jgi:diadenosine tetraphosphate (Ap4A) HIT family hydrolase
MFFGKKPPSCVFCNPQVLARQVLFEDKDVLVVYPYKPVVFGHILILPKRHVERLENLTPEEFLVMGKTIQKVHAHVSQVFKEKDYLILQKNGKLAGQSVPHVHFHYLPRSDKMRDMSFALRLLFGHYFKPLPEKELAGRVETLKVAIAS